MLAWMGAAPSHLHQLDRVQRHSLHIIVQDAILLHHADISLNSASYYKLICMFGPNQLTAMVPPLQLSPGPAWARSNHRVQARHAFQVSEQLPVAAPKFLRRGFPHCIVHTVEWEIFVRNTFLLYSFGKQP